MNNYENLEKLAELKSKKIITDEEFNEHKKAILEMSLIKSQECSLDRKNGVVYVLLAWFLGTLGIHNFYAGYNGKALTQLVLTLFSWVLFFVPLAIVSVWAFVEMLVVNKDEKGCEFGGDKKVVTALRVIAVVFVATAFIGIFSFMSFMMMPSILPIPQAAFISVN